MKPPHDMSAKEYARWLNETCCIRFDEACRIAGYDPQAEYRRDAYLFVATVASVSLAVIALALIPGGW